MHWRSKIFPYSLRYEECTRIVVWVSRPPLLKIHDILFLCEVWTIFVVHYECIHVAPGDRLVIIRFLFIEQFRFFFCLFCFEQLRFCSNCSISTYSWDSSNLRWLIAFTDNGDFTFRRLRRRLGDRRRRITRKTIFVWWWDSWFFIFWWTGALGISLWFGFSSLRWSLGLGRFSRCFGLCLNRFFWDGFFLYFAVVEFFHFNYLFGRWFWVVSFRYLSICSFFGGSPTISGLNHLIYK